MNIELLSFYSMFQPSKKILTNYARVLVDFALGGGEGIKEKQIVYLQYDQPALPLALAVYQRILEKGAYPMVKGLEENFSKIFYQIAKDDQLEFFPKKYYRSLVDTIDHRISLLAPRNPLLLKKADPRKIALANKPLWDLKKWYFEKENQGKFTWTLAFYGTSGLARQAKISLRDYWQQIIKACFLDETDPIGKWRKVFRELEILRNKINQLKIKRIHLLAKDTDLWIGLGEKRKFVGGSGRNIPSFEIFTSPDWRLIEGKIYFDFPLYRYGNIIKGIYLEFKNGKVVKAKAKENEKLLLEIIKQKNADRIGEFSLTDRRFSRITKFMANTLYDENFGGKYGNTHLALGSSYHDCFDVNLKKMKEKDFEKLGFNHSAEHVDIIATTDRIVEAVLVNGEKRVIYERGEFRL